MMEEIRVSRSGIRMWLIALAGVPMVVIGVDVLLRRRIFGVFSSLVFTGDPPPVEPRDVIWAVVLLILGLIFIGFGLRELLVPSPVLVADAFGLHLHLGHPLSRLVTIPWSEVDDIGAEDLDDDGSVIPVMWVRGLNPEQLPANPWGARWIEPDTLAVMAADWERTPRFVAETAAEIAVSAAQVPDLPVVESAAERMAREALFGSPPGPGAVAGSTDTEVIT
ncbi:MAG TPA: hypothetical protein VLS86_00705 [Acidimicrobiia bacterium]|nr:hypothetical protein [Acidimicrobiia bacterium]